jgi:hypothetical protein
MKSMRRAKWMLGIVALGLLLSGVTVWPAAAELKALEHVVWGEGQPSGEVGAFVDKAIGGLEQTRENYPFLLYAHDWLAFAHIMLAILFLGALRDPVRNKWIVQCGLIMCLLILVLAGAGIPLRGLPWQWFFVDAAFGVVAGVLLGIAYSDIRAAEKATSGASV